MLNLREPQAREELHERVPSLAKSRDANPHL